MLSTLLGRCAAEEWSTWNRNAWERQEGRGPQDTKRFSWVAPLRGLAASQGLGNVNPGFVRCADTKLLGPCQLKWMATASHQRSCAPRKTQRLASPTRQIKGLFSFVFKKKRVSSLILGKKKSQFLHPSYASWRNMDDHEGAVWFHSYHTQGGSPWVWIMIPCWKTLLTSKEKASGKTRESTRVPLNTHSQTLSVSRLRSQHPVINPKSKARVTESTYA